jgi:hypothetical protein
VTYTCPWCKDGLTSPYVPEDDDDAEMVLCGTCFAEYLGTSEVMLDRADDAFYKDLL